MLDNLKLDIQGGARNLVKRPGFTFVAVDGGVRDSAGVWAMRIVLWAYPLVPLACTVLAWKAYRRGHTGRAVKATSVAFVAAVLLIAYVLWATGPV